MARQEPRPPESTHDPKPQFHAEAALHPDWVFYLCLALLGGTYLVLIVAMLAADLFFTTPGHVLEALGSPEIQYAIKLSLISCSITAILSLWVAVPIGYLLARTQFSGQGVARCAAGHPDRAAAVGDRLELADFVSDAAGQWFFSGTFSR